MSQIRKISWWARGPFEQMDEGYFVSSIETAASYWMQCCGVEITRAKRAEQAKLFIQQGPLYPMPQALAYSDTFSAHPSGELNITLFVQKANWTISQRTSPGEFDIVRIIAHEMGHAVLGLPHLPAGNLMQEAYSHDIRTPQEGDIRMAMKKFGKPAYLQN